jgi:hypothetical protein
MSYHPFTGAAALEHGYKDSDGNYCFVWQGQYFAGDGYDLTHMGGLVCHAPKAETNCRHFISSDPDGGPLPLTRLLNGGTGATMKVAKGSDALSLHCNDSQWTRKGFAGESQVIQPKARRTRQIRDEAGMFTNVTEPVPDPRALGRKRNLVEAARQKHRDKVEAEVLRRANATSKYSFRSSQ